MNKHEQLDNIYKLLDNFQDNFVEEFIIILFKNDKNFIPNLQACANILPVGTDLPTLLNSIESTFTDLKSKLSISSIEHFAGIESLVDNFIHDFNIIQYRIQMN